MKRRGQISYYIVIALIILFSFLVIYFVQRSLSPEDKYLRETLTDVPLDFKPVQYYVNYNIELGLITAIKNLGQHSGYVDPYSLPYPGNLGDPTEAVALKPFTGSDRILPYWFFMESDNSCDEMCSFATLMPKLHSPYEINRPFNDLSIEAQIDRHIAKKLYDLDFSSFKAQDIDVERVGPIAVSTKVRDGSVITLVDFPIKLIKGSKVVDLVYFEAEVSSELERTYELAARITNRQKDLKFIENHVLNLISIYSDLDTNRLPPLVRRVELGGPPLYWDILGVKNKLSMEVLSKVSVLTVKDTHNFNPSTLLTGAVVDTGTTKFQDVDVLFYAPNQPFYFAVNNLPSGLAGPKTLTRNLIFFTMVFHQYAFSYDLSFPVLVAINVPRGLNNEDYIFQFALEANIRNSNPIREGESPEDIGEQTMMCDANQWVSGDIELRTSTGIGNPVPNADVYFQCAGESCYVGRSDQAGVLKSRLPVCIGGFFEAYADGYIGRRSEFDSTLDQPGFSQLFLDQTKKFTIDAQKLPISPVKSSGKYKWPHETSGGVFGLSTQPTGLEADEYMFIMFEKVDDDSTPYQFLAQVTPNEPLHDIHLAVGEYKVTMTLFKNRTLHIPKKECPAITNGWLCFEADAVDLESVQLGGGIIDQSIGYFKLKESDIDKEKITVYGVYFDIFQIPEDELKHRHLSPLGKLEEYSRVLKNYKPELE